MKNHFGLRAFAYCLLPIGYWLFSSCGNPEFEGFDRSPNGLMYKFHSRGTDTAHPVYGEVVTVKITKRLGDSIVESTEGSFPNGVDQYLQEPKFKGAIEEGIVMMVIGDSATFLIPADSIKKLYPALDSFNRIDPGSYFAFDIKLVNIKTEELVEWEQQQKFMQYVNGRKEKEPKELGQYIADNHVEVSPTASGLYLTVITKGTGPVPRDGDSVVIHYTGSFLDGTIFDSSVKRNEPWGFKVGSKRVIEGWEQAVKMMKKGTTATIILPSSLAYDSTGWFDRQSRKFFIPPYTPMKFDIQLIDINPK